MQRVTRDSATYPQQALSALDAKVELIRRHFPPSVASLYATPRTGDDGNLQWWSELAGQPHPYAELNADQQRRLLEKYHQRQHAIGHLANELQNRGQDDTAASLRSLIGAPDLANLYSLNDEPLVVRWGLPPPPPVAPAAPPLPPRSTPAPRKTWRLRLSLWWLLLPLLLLLLLWLLWFWRGYLLHLIDPTPMTSYACQPEGARAPDFAVVLDTSGSMNLNIDASPEDEQWINTLGGNLPDTNPRRVRVLSEPTRLSVAKQAFVGMLDNLHPDIDTRLITFDGCYNQIDQGLFSQSQRAQLKRGVQQLGANDGTPLASSLELAASQVDGRLHDALVVMFVDGEDGCERNACAVSRSIARQQPRLRVNVVNISDSELSNCIAENTGGRVYTARNAAEVASMLREASQEVSANPGCP
ncbi:VWA domain-containing protein [Stutzerimonas stutzeri]|uniref:VWA domain-containing protein n=1 Tax=Stutzerimonas stutzeri TaxID=316 RepID=UPI0015E285EE|nr:VWA domain-containing protein [Stutzerimonas stutzeri]MBA1262728.1 VWA domain-containing protein [Stutzerimonas stutzeri]